jgi:hypothetical protein
MLKVPTNETPITLGILLLVITLGSMGIEVLQAPLPPTLEHK